MIDHQIQERHRIRRQLLAERDRMSLPARDDASERIVASVLSLPFFQEKQHFFIYCHFRSEVRTIPLLACCLAQGKTVSVPMSLPDEARMLAVLISDPIHDLAPGYMGIPEPLPSSVPERMQPPAAIEVAVIPGTGFDRLGHRLGYGKGYYDRFLVQAPRAIRIGLAFSCQMVDRIPAQEHDVPMDLIITEQGVLTMPGRMRAPDRGL